MDEAAKRQRLRAGENGDDHRFALVVERAVDVLKRRAAVQIDGDEVDDRIRVRRDDLETLFHAEAVGHVIDQNGFHQQAEDAEQAGLNTEAEKRRQRNQRVGNHQRHADVQARIFAHDHGDDVRSAAGGVQMEQNRRTDGRKQYREAQFQQRLVRQRVVKRPEALHDVDRQRQHDRAIHRAERETAPQKDEPYHQQRHVDDEHKGARSQHRGGENAPQNQRKAADAAGGKVVREFEEVNADGGEQHAEGQQNIPFNLAHRLGRCGFHGRSVPFT